MLYQYGKIFATTVAAMAFSVGAAHAAQEILLGTEIPLTGSMARVGTNTHEGIETAVEMFNESQDKYKIKLLTIDNESSPAKAVAAVEKLAADGVVGLSGGYGTNVVGPAAEAAEKLGIPYVVAGVVSDVINDRGFKTFFRVVNTEGYRKALQGLVGVMNVKSLSIVYSTKEATANLAADVQKSMEKQGIKVVMHDFDPAITDFKPIINKVKLQDKPDVLLMIGYENDYLGILRAAKVLKPQIKAAMGVWGLATTQMANDYSDLVNHTYGTTMMSYPPQFLTEEGRRFAEKYTKKFQKEPDYLAVYGYSQTIVLLEAIARSADKGTLKSGGVLEEMKKTDRETLIGRIQFDAKGNNPHFSQRIGQHQNGKIVLVWPEEAATGKMIFPSVPW